MDGDSVIEGGVSMKKRVVLILCCCIMLSVAGCEKSRESNVQNDPTPEETEIQNNETEKTPQVEESILQEEQNQLGEEERETETVAKKTEVTIYKIDPDSGELITEIKECNEINEDRIWDYLIEAGSVPKDSEVCALVKEGEQLKLDVDKTFGEWLRSFGTTGEQEIISCVVNTYLDAYGAKSIKITEEGETLCSGHMEYEEYMKKY